MTIFITDDPTTMAAHAAQVISEQVRAKPNSVLGLATGSTPAGLYKHLAKLSQEEGLNFSGVNTFNLDEYAGLPPEHAQSYRAFMNVNLFSKININIENTHMPNGCAEDVDSECNEYERLIEKSGGIDLQLLGIGVNGHIAFNEPGSPVDSRTRMVALADQTIRDNGRFFASLVEVPRFAVTMGIGTILEARRILLLATGASKARAIRQAVQDSVTPSSPASALQLHPNVTVITDAQAAAQLAPASVR